MLNRLLKKTNNLKLKHKLIVSYILIVLIPIMIVGSIITYYFRQQTLERAVEQASNNVEKLRIQTETMLKVPLKISDSLLLNEKMAQTVNTSYPDALELTKSYLSFTDFRTYKVQYKEISGVRIYFDNPTLVNNLEIIPATPDVKASSWYQEAMGTRSVKWMYVEGEPDAPVKRLSLVRQVLFSDYHTSGVLLVMMNQDELNRMLTQEPFETMITDQNGYVVAAKNADMVGQTMQQLGLGNSFGKLEKGTYKKVINGKESYVVVDSVQTESSLDELNVISLFNTKSIVSDANKVGLLGMGIILLVLLIALIFVYTVSFMTSKRLLLLSRKFNKLALGNLNVVSQIDGSDEIGQLSRQFNYMVESISMLMKQVVEATEQNNRMEIAQREIKLKMMASQINPHFLFNALESIRMNAYLKGEKELANIVRLLGKLMRKNLEIGREHVTIKNEMEMVSSYLEIQRFRYEDRLEFELQIDPGLGSLHIPPLIIQPLVENAVVHGLENKDGVVTIQVKLIVADGSLHVCVEDNGSGMSEEKLQEVLLFISGPEEDNNRIGLRNVHQRLVLTYGEASGLQIESVYGEGTTMRFYVPLELLTAI
ncbi:sensor histidine kinase [Paenibacillus protaetiae]|uniref:Sensor histidine kinase n=1 Tax=Paenibacillus protaetiae TaxID=2509456 RepID=A0A4V0YF67_9BACL|nr:sensor histidine kinase [Paenibacillus protaetiae]QAY66651.1 sensor histidine kinase [Paenibacillus protaetiae]